MSKPSYVLQALKILGPEEIPKFAGTEKLRKPHLKKVSGLDFSEFEDTEFDIKPPAIIEAKVLAFPTLKQPTEKSLQEEPTADHPTPDHLSTEEVLLHRSSHGPGGHNVYKLDAFGKYAKSNEMYVVKSESEVGKKHTRFAATNGVLINKKQA
ncbi:MAG TPA: hypothetical protein VNJ01_14660 [Bacteriovoracaceae bacterium]|nr:hypothetical protein [Bacteriovoracaceae bacterium]